MSGTNRSGLKGIEESNLKFGEKREMRRDFNYHMKCDKGSEVIKDHDRLDYCRYLEEINIENESYKKMWGDLKKLFPGPVEVEPCGCDCHNGVINIMTPTTYFITKEVIEDIEKRHLK
jgi:hypothetical protein